MKISIVMPYFERQYQLNKTLETISKSEHTDFNIVIVDDCSTNDIVLPSMPYPIEVVKLTRNDWTNCSPVWNIGFNTALESNPDAVFLQSAECYHCGDILSHVEQNLKDNNYLAYGCFQIDKETTLNKNHDILQLSRDCKSKVTTGNHGLGQNAWWNHSVYNPLPQYWGCAITAENLRKINGIDERFANGYAIEDGYFVWQVEMMGLKIEIIDYPFVVHQWHNRIYPHDVPTLVKKNKDLYDILIGDNDFVSKHTITPNLQ